MMTLKYRVNYSVTYDYITKQQKEVPFGREAVLREFSVYPDRVTLRSDDFIDPSGKDFKISNGQSEWLFPDYELTPSADKGNYILQKPKKRVISDSPLEWAESNLLFDGEPFKANYLQRLMLASDESIDMNCHRRAGSTIGSVVIALHKALTTPRSKILVVLDSYTEVEEFISNITYFSGSYSIQKSNKVVSFSNGSTVLFSTGEKITNNVSGQIFDLIISYPWISIVFDDIHKSPGFKIVLNHKSSIYNVSYLKDLKILVYRNIFLPVTSNPELSDLERKEFANFDKKIFNREYLLKE